MHVAQDREKPLVSRIGKGRGKGCWSRSDGQREERRDLRNHTKSLGGMPQFCLAGGGGAGKDRAARSAETQPQGGVDNKNARSAARRCRSRCSKLTPRTRGAKEERGMSADST